MSNVVFILGAGASKAAGAPLMAEFLDVARRLYSRGEVEEYRKDFELVFFAIGKLQNVHSKTQIDIYNIESIFSIFEMATILQKFPDTSIDYNRLTVSLRRVIGATIEHTLEVPMGPSNIRSPIPYGGFIKLISHLQKEAFPRRKAAIITFNYDLACDLALTNERIPFSYALDDQVDDASIPLLKLHGSLNWVKCKNRDQVVPYGLEDINRLIKALSHKDIRSNAKLLIVPQLYDYKWNDEETIPEPVLVPPTWNKSQHHANLTQVWSRAAKELSDAEDIYVIGYSLPETDLFFQYLYALGTVGNNPIQRFWVFNPNENVEHRFKDMLGSGALSRFRFYKKNFAEAIVTIKSEYPSP